MQSSYGLQQDGVGEGGVGRGNGVVGNPQELNLLKCTWVGN